MTESGQNRWENECVHSGWGGWVDEWMGGWKSRWIFGFTDSWVKSTVNNYDKDHLRPLWK